MHRPPDNSCGFKEKLTGISVGNRAVLNFVQAGISGLRGPNPQYKSNKPKFKNVGRYFITLYLCLLQFLSNPPGFWLIFFASMMRLNLYHFGPLEMHKKKFDGCKIWSCCQADLQSSVAD